MHIYQDAECNLDENAYKASIGDKFITKYLLGWFRIDSKYTNHKPKLTSVESFFKGIISNPLKRLLKIEEIYSDNSNFHQLICSLILLALQLEIIFL